MPRPKPTGRSYVCPACWDQKGERVLSPELAGQGMRCTCGYRWKAANHEKPFGKMHGLGFPMPGDKPCDWDRPTERKG